MIAVLLCAVALATAAVVGKNDGGSGAAPALKTAVTGTVVLSPATPVCRLGQSCSRPLAGFTLVFSQRASVVARAKTDRHGRYRISLRPGAYGVRTPRGHTAGQGLEPTRIRIRAVGHATVDFTYDAGIR